MYRVTRALARHNGLPYSRALMPVRQSPALSLTQLSLPASALQRANFASKRDDKADPPPPKQPIDYEAEREIGKRKLEARPEQVSVKSTTTNELKTPIENTAGQPIMQNELKHDMGIIKDTFSLDNVPRESKILGLAGTLPYLATSVSTVYLAWDLKQTVPTGNALYDAIVIDHGTAQYLLSAVEPIQLGYGAVIISFLGAIHWGLEYAEKAPHPQRTRFRYGMGLMSSVVAWPTLMMPVPYALTTQFMAFVGLYFADARATTRGWAPQWYGSYRFMLTALVGLALFVSLIGRQKIGQGNTLTSEGLQDRLEQTGRADHETDWAKLEAEERERRRKAKAEAEKKAKKEEAEKKSKKSDGKAKVKQAEEIDKAKNNDKDGEGEEADGENKDQQQGSEEQDDKKEGAEQKDDEKDGNDTKNGNEKDDNEKDDNEKDNSEKDNNEKDNNEKSDKADDKDSQKKKDDKGAKDKKPEEKSDEGKDQGGEKGGDDKKKSGGSK
ncbi:mitochondrial inner membrane protein 1 [Sarocladium implicatum]|nr:mitochondrial inner membrane protein 1 [Sarocladium implicatum]